VAALGANDDPLLDCSAAFGLRSGVSDRRSGAKRAARERPARHRALRAGSLLAYDRATGRGVVLSYDFAWKGASTAGLPRDTAESVYARTPRPGFSDHAPGEYQATVETARAAFARGDLFEAVPGQLLPNPASARRGSVSSGCAGSIRRPYGALMNLGDGEFSGVGVAGDVRGAATAAGSRPARYSGTIARGVDAIGDAEQIRQLLNSEKGRIRTHMCTDVDQQRRQGAGLRARTIKVLARRQIETYSKLFHTVDHVEGMLRPVSTRLMRSSPTPGR